MPAADIVAVWDRLHEILKTETTLRELLLTDERRGRVRTQIEDQGGDPEARLADKFFGYKLSDDPSRSIACRARRTPAASTASRPR